MDLQLEHPEEFSQYEKKLSQSSNEEIKKANYNKLEALNNNILNYMIKEVQPIHQLSNRNFQKIFTGI